MKLIIKGDYEGFELQLLNIFNITKKDEDKLVFIHDKIPEYDKTEYIEVNIKCIFGNNTVTATISAKVDNKDYELVQSASITDIDNIKEINKVKKRVISRTWLKFLETITRIEQSWGILTGIRPVKLYHNLFNKLDSHDLVKKELEEKYLLKSDKIDLLKEIVIKQLKVIPDFNNIDKEVSIYIGIPYCPTKCAYCTFPAYAIRTEQDSVNGFLNTLYHEIEAVGSWIKKSKIKVTSLYIGGGTPTSLNPNELDEIFNRLATWLDLKSIREITVEAGRPDTITEKKLDILSKWNVDRICINPQSFSNETLKIIGRNHTAEDIINKYYLAREKKFSNINMDLIVGLPGEDINNITKSLKQLEILKPDSITIHSMAFKKHSELTRNKINYQISERDEILEMMDYVYEWMEINKYSPYYLYRQKNILGNLENVGFSLNNKENIYNISIIAEKQTIIALGCGAVSKLIKPNTTEVIRMPNPKDPNTYIDSINTLINKKITKLNDIFSV